VSFTNAGSETVGAKTREGLEEPDPTILVVARAVSPSWFPFQIEEVLMSRNFTFSNLDHFDALERKLSMSAMAGSLAVVAFAPNDDVPPPDPEPDPGPFPGSPQLALAAGRTS
jgi:hypothetical protein